MAPHRRNGSIAILGVVLAGTAAVAAGPGHALVGQAASGDRGTCQLWTRSAPPATSTNNVGPQAVAGQQMELTGEQLSVSSDGRTLHVVLNVANMTEQVPPGATEARWMATWDYGSTTQAVAAILDIKDGVRYVDGTSGGSSTGPAGPGGEITVAHTDTGSFVTGANGSVEIDVPLVNLAPVRLGSKLSGPSAKTEAWAQVTAAVLVFSSSGPYGDSGGPDKDYVVGKGCGPSSAHTARAAAARSGHTAPQGVAPLLRRSVVRFWRAW